MRKVILGGAAVLLVLGGFFLYQWLSPTPPIQVVSEGGANPFEDAAPIDGTSALGETNFGPVETTRYVRLDPVTKEVREVFGFAALMNARQEGLVLQVQRPYMIRYEPKSTVRIDADWGRMEVERVGSETVLRNAELTDNVVIRIQRGTPPETEESVLQLDNLTYSSDRSEFFTEGPIRMTSANAELTGRGLTLLYDPRLERLEYMKVKDLDLLRLKNMATPGKMPLSETPTAGAAKSDSPAKQEPPAVASAAASRQTAAPTQSTPKEASATARENLFYQCSILENVEIRYGQELVVFGVDEVNINRIFWEGNKEDQDTPEPKESPVVVTPAAASEQVAVKPASEPLNDPPAKPEPRQTEPADPSRDILVTCDGGIIVQPMDPAAESGSTEPEIQMQGRALRIDKLSKDLPQQPLLSCQTLRYAWNNEVLEMLPGTPQEPITLYLDEAGGEIETQGSVFWDRRANKARIDGPGRILFAGSDSTSDTKGQLLFGGLMDLLFADNQDAQDASSMSLKTAQITGGVETFLPEQGLRSSSRTADFHFGPSNTPQRIDMEGDVKFETQTRQEKSTAAATRSTLLFDPQGLLESATLDGQVRMTSGKGLIRAGTAFLVFAEDESGETMVQRVEMTGQPVLENQTGSGKPARFEAQRIDYDYLNGKAVAAGSVEFTFEVMDPNRPDQAPMPVTITATDRAEFLTDGDMIKQVSFYGNVVGTSELKTDSERLVRRFYGQTMEVFLAAGQDRPERITVKDGEVKLQSIHYVDGQKVNHVELDCEQFDYDGLNERITATGPGTVQLNNQETSASSAVEGGLDLKQPCYAFVKGFDRLSWNLASDTMMAYGQDGIYVGYIPVKDGAMGDKIEVECVHAVARMAPSASGKRQLSEVVATGGIACRQFGSNGRSLLGEKLTYKKDDSWVVIEGSENNPARIDNVRVPKIEFNPATGEIKSRLNAAPSPVQIP